MKWDIPGNLDQKTARLRLDSGCLKSKKNPAKF